MSDLPHIVKILLEAGADANVPGSLLYHRPKASVLSRMDPLELQSKERQICALLNNLTKTEESHINENCQMRLRKEEILCPL